VRPDLAANGLIKYGTPDSALFRITRSEQAGVGATKASTAETAQRHGQHAAEQAGVDVTKASTAETVSGTSSTR
jgi:hypothetical protein